MSSAVAFSSHWPTPVVASPELAPHLKTDEAGEDAFFQTLLRDFCCAEIQRVVRGWLARKAFLAQRRAALRIQRTWRRVWPDIKQHVEAARTIKRAWGTHICRLSYQALRGFVYAAEGSNPRRALAAIAQCVEAGLADAAAGVRVRFRLASTTSYQPQLVYCLVTHRPVAQLGDGSQGGLAPRPTATTWRPVPADLYSNLPRVSRMIAQLKGPGAAVQRGSSGGRGGPGSSSSVVGGGPRHSLDKHRRLQRLQQLYEEGRQQEEQGVAGGAEPEVAACGLGEGKVWPAGEEEDEEMEQWCHQLLQLDFNSYMANWLELGGSAWTDEAAAGQEQ